MSPRRTPGAPRRTNLKAQDLSKKIQDLPDPWAMPSQEDDLVP